MKKTALIALLLSLMTIHAKAQWFDFSQNDYDVTVGVNVGAVGYDFNGSSIDKTFADLGVGVSASFLGVYVDFIYQSPEHRWGNKIEQMVYDDHSALTINAGYKIPVLPWLTLIPMIGYSNETTGKTDCSTINVDYENHSIYHDYDVEHRFNHFNYGAGLSVKVIDWLEIGGVCTSHAVYGNISFNPIKVKKQ